MEITLQKNDDGNELNPAVGIIWNVIVVMQLSSQPNLFTSL